MVKAMVHENKTDNVRYDVPTIEILSAWKLVIPKQALLIRFWKQRKAKKDLYRFSHEIEHYFDNSYKINSKKLRKDCKKWVAVRSKRY
jgi:hypothetical protein